MRKSTKTTVLIVACAAILVVVLGFFTSGFQKWSKDDVLSKITPQVNEENYYSENCVTLVDTNDGTGVKIDVNEDNGVITLNGAAASDLTGDNAYKVGKLTLEAGEYTFTSYDYASYGGVYLTASTGTSVINFDFTPGNTVELKSTTELTIYLNIAKDAEFKNVVIEPVIVSGTEAGNFWD